MLSRRGFIIGALAAPAVVKAELLMPVRVPPVTLITRYHWHHYRAEAKAALYAYLYSAEGSGSDMLRSVEPVMDVSAIPARLLRNAQVIHYRGGVGERARDFVNAKL